MATTAQPTGGPLWGLSSPDSGFASTPASTEVDVTQIDPATGAVTADRAGQRPDRRSHRPRRSWPRRQPAAANQVVVAPRLHRLSTAPLNDPTGRGATAPRPGCVPDQ